MATKTPTRVKGLTGGNLEERRLPEHAKLRELMDEKRRIDNAIMTERLRLRR